MRRRRAPILLLTTLVSALIVGVVSSSDLILEHWYLHQLARSSEDEKYEVALRFGRVLPAQAARHCIELLQEIMPSSEEHLRTTWQFRALSAGDRETARVITDSMADDDDWWRYCCVQVLTELGEESQMATPRLLEEFVCNPTSQVEPPYDRPFLTAPHYATHALVAIGEETIEDLESLLHHEDSRVRHHADNALLRMGVDRTPAGRRVSAGTAAATGSFGWTSASTTFLPATRHHGSSEVASSVGLWLPPGIALAPENETGALGPPSEGSPAPSGADSAAAEEPRP